MILVDAGPLVALIDRGEQDHDLCLKTLSSLSAPMVTTWPAFTEAMYLLGSAGGWKAQEALWKLLGRGDLQLVVLDTPLQNRARALMTKYREMPMDLADASLDAINGKLLGYIRCANARADRRLDATAAAQGMSPDAVLSRLVQTIPSGRVGT